MSPDMEDAYNDSRREVRDMKQVDVNGDIPEKSNEQLAKEAKDAAKAAKKAAKAQAKAPAIAPPVEPTAELPGDRIKATARRATEEVHGLALVNKNWTQKTKFFSDSILSLDSSVLFTILSWC